MQTKGSVESNLCSCGNWNEIVVNIFSLLKITTREIYGCFDNWAEIFYQLCVHFIFFRGLSYVRQAVNPLYKQYLVIF